MRRFLDTSVLITHWRRCVVGTPLRDATATDVKKWATDLKARYGASAIVTPVRIEFLAGTQSQHEQMLSLVYLDEFTNVDAGNVKPEDFAVAERLAKRVPRNGKRRQLGDCLIKAIARRLSYEVVSLDAGFNA